jgi:hypothetical protein
MKRSEIVKKLISEGFSEKTLSNLNDKQLSALSERVLGEEDVMISKRDPQYQEKITTAKKQNKTIETYEEKKPSAGLSKEKKSEVVKKAKKGGDIDKKGKGFEKVVDKTKKSGAKNPEAVATTQMSKSIPRKEKVNEMKNWVKELSESKYSNFTSKSEIMGIINEKVMTAEIPMPKSKPSKGHNGVPEFMTYDSIVGGPETAEPIVKPDTKPVTRPSIDPYDPKPGVNPNPKAGIKKIKK